VRPKESLEYFRAFCRKLVTFCVREIQGIYVYRWIARSLQFFIEIKEADERELKAFHAWHRPHNNGTSVSKDPRATDFVARKGNKIIGFAQLVRHSENIDFCEGYWLFGLVVKTLHRGMGIGERLGQAVIEKAREEGAKEIFLLVRDNNHQAIELYRKLGFRMKVIPKLEAQLSKEVELGAHRRVAMTKSLSESERN